MTGATYSAILARCQGIAGLRQVEFGLPEPFPWTAVPLLSIGHGREVHWEQLTLGPDGIVEVGTLVPLTLVLGSPELRPADAQASAADFPDRLRAVFMGADRTLGGTCWDAVLSAATNNLDSYAARSEPPSLAWRLAILEHLPLGTPAP